MYKKIKIFLFSVSFILLSYVKVADASVLYSVVSTPSLYAGQEFYIDLKIDSEDDNINAFQTVLNFPPEKIVLLEFNKQNSSFGLWVEEPQLPETDGKIRMVAGATNGLSGKSINVARLKFKVLSAGNIKFEMSDSAVTANDGKGTNVLSLARDLTVNALPGKEEVVATSTIPVVKQPIVVPQKVERKAIPAQSLPTTPDISIPLYPDQSKWYNHLGETIVLWSLPNDITQISFEIDRNPNTIPRKIENELFTGKTVGLLEDGVWYAHARFKNNIGWSKVAHYKISIDTSAPLPFKTKTASETTDNPTPEIEYEAQDTLSGIENYSISLDEKEPVFTKDKKMKLSALSPGSHRVVVNAYDMAKNTVSDTLSLEILPIQAPIINYYVKKINKGERGVIFGNTIQDSTVNVKVFDSKRAEVFSGYSSEHGEDWHIIIDKTLDPGMYMITVTAIDDRGASSYPTGPVFMEVGQSVLFSVGTIDIGWIELFLLLGILILALFFSEIKYHFYSSRKLKICNEFVDRSFKKIYKFLKYDLSKELKKISGSKDDKKRKEIEEHYEKIKGGIEKLETEIEKEAEKLK